MTENNETSIETPTPTRRRWRRKGTRRSLIALVVLLLLVVIITVVPTYLARYFANDTLERFGIESEGIDTLRVNLWKREVWLGPLRFRTGEGDYGRLGMLGVKVNLLAAFEKHALIDRILVEGIDIVVTQDAGQALMLNGIPLSQFTAQEPPAEQPVDEEETENPWGAGLVDLELRDSRLLFHQSDGGRLTVEVDQLDLGDLKTWQPEEEGGFALKGRVNNVAFDLNGTVRPFASDIALTVDGTVSGAELEKIQAFTGDLGFDRDAGVLDADLDLGLTFKAEGGLDGGVVGRLGASGVDYAQPDGFALALERMDADVDLRFSLSEAGDFSIGGRVNAGATGMRGEISDEQSFSSGELKVELTDLNVDVGADNALQVSAIPALEAKSGTFSGPVHLSMDAVLKALSALQSISAVEPVQGEQTGLSDWSDGEATLPKSDVTVDSLAAKASIFSLSTVGGAVSLDLTSASDLSGIEVVSSGRTTTVESLHNELENLQMRSGEGKLTLSLSGRNEGRGGQAKGPAGVLGFDALRTAITTLNLEVEQGHVATRVAAGVELADANLLLYATEELPEASADLGSASFTLNEGTFEQTGQSVAWHAAADASVEAASMVYGKGGFATAKLASLTAKGVQADQDLNLVAEDLTAGGLDVVLTRRFLKGLGAATAVEEVPEGAPPSPELVSDVQQALIDLGYDPGPADGLPGRKTEAAIREFQRSQGIAETGRASEALLKQLKAALAKQTEPPPFELRLGRLAVLDGAHVRFTDETVSPTVSIDTKVETLELKNVDTTRADTIASAELLAHINEFTRIALDGTGSHLGAKANLQGKASIEQLELPTYSPYVAELSGVYMERGQLTTFAQAKAEEGALDGNIKLEVLHPEFAPLSEADAKRLADKAGVPLETAVNLLQDGDGRIRLNLPVGGTVEKPDIDISGAINKAIGNALKKVFPPTLVVSMLSSMQKGLAGVPSFEPFVFAPGSAELDENATAYANKLSDLLNDKPKLSLQVCGRATAADLEAAAGSLPAAGDAANAEAVAAAAAARAELAGQYETQLRELAVERTRAVRRYLINEKGVEAKRLGECRTEFSAEDTDPPRVMVSL